jgi:hypothetical protein
MLWLNLALLLIQIEIPGFPDSSVAVDELLLRSDAEEARVRPLETTVIQLQAFGVVEDLDGEGRRVRLQAGGADFKLDAPNTGWLSKPFRYQGEEEIPFYESETAGLASIILGRASNEFVLQDSVLYTAPDKPGTYSITATRDGKTANISVHVDPQAPSNKQEETTAFGSEELPKDIYRRLAEHYAPLVAQETWFQPKADFITRFDYDGDWQGDNNWDSLDQGTSQAYVYYTTMETETHCFLIYNFFHPRDYSDKCIAGTCHENDNEGLILTIRKDGSEYGYLQVMETLAHNNVYSYRRDKGVRGNVHNIDGELELYEGSHPVVFIESGGHGVYGSTDSHSRFSLKEDHFSTGTGVTYTFKGTAERPPNPNARMVGYELLTIYHHWWLRSQKDDRAKAETFDAYYSYRPRGGRPMAAFDQIAGSFLGRRFGSNKAKPFWGWHDQRTGGKNVLATGQWGLDPAYSVSRNLRMPPPHSLTYIRNRYLKVGKTSSNSASKERKESGQQSERRNSGREPAPEARSSSLPPLQGDPLPGLVRSSVRTSAKEGSFFFYGEIDDEAVLRIRGSEVTAETIRGRPVITKGAILTGVLSTSHSTSSVDVKKGLGRGSVELLERPTRENGYTVVIRIRDDKGGSDQYRIHLTWQE